MTGYGEFAHGGGMIDTFTFGLAAKRARQTVKTRAQPTLQTGEGNSGFLMHRSSHGEKSGCSGERKAQKPSKPRAKKVLPQQCQALAPATIEEEQIYPLVILRINTESATEKGARFRLH